MVTMNRISSRLKSMLTRKDVFTGPLGLMTQWPRVGRAYGIAVAFLALFAVAWVLGRCCIPVVFCASSQDVDISCNWVLFFVSSAWLSFS